MDDQVRLSIQVCLMRSLDAIKRCRDGMDSETWHYAADQAKLAAHALADLAWTLDLQDLLKQEHIPEDGPATTPR